MWKLKGPTLETTKKDLDNVIKENGKIVVSGDRATIEQLYEEYYVGKGSIAEETHDNFDKRKALVLYGYYQRTYENGDLHYIREELFDHKSRLCPYCSINFYETLDHYMPESVYKELAICRANLVPMCYTCNRKKHDKTYTEFTHPYFQDFPRTNPFFKCDIAIDANGDFSFIYTFDENLDPALKGKLENQVGHINLFARLDSEVNQFLNGIFIYQDFESQEHLRCFLQEEYKKAKILYKENDWRTTLLKALKESEGFTYIVANKYVKKIPNEVDPEDGI